MEPSPTAHFLSLARSDENVGVPVPTERERGRRSMTGEWGDGARVVIIIWYGVVVCRSPIQ